MKNILVILMLIRPDEEGYRILSSKIIVEEVESEDHQISLVEVKQVAEMLK